VTADGHDVKNALTALRLQVEVTSDAVGNEAMAPVLRLVDRVEAAVDALLTPDTPEG
jgi:hypothetical protein